MTLIVGIDPGYSGAIAFLEAETNRLFLQDMPVAPNKKGKDELDLYRIGEVLDPSFSDFAPERCLAVLEQVATMPGQGISSAFRFGEGYGVLQMALMGHGWELQKVRPSIWKKHFGLSSDKGVSRALAQQRFPKNASEFARVKDDGRAEAALIALYGKEKLL